DTAYCLLGIFGIHMALLYGEGRNAFRRLQEELIKISADQPIFAWTHPVWQQALTCGVLPISPERLCRCGKLTQSPTRLDMPPPSRHSSPSRPPASISVKNNLIGQSRGPISSSRRNAHAVTNTGLQIELPVIEDLSIPGLSIWH